MADAVLPKNSTGRVLFASLIGTTIEFFDFYIYATAAVLVFPRLFFPASDPASATLASLATFAVAFFARPVGSALFGAGKEIAVELPGIRGLAQAARDAADGGGAPDGAGAPA